MLVRYLARLTALLFFYDGRLLSASRIPQHEAILVAGERDIRTVRT
jgi:hypothetical protein